MNVVAFIPNKEQRQARTPGRTGARQYKVVDEENTPVVKEDDTQPLKELRNGVFCDLSREYLYDRVMVDAKDAEGESGKEIRYKKRRLQFSGMPRVISCYKIEKHGQRNRDEEAFYKVEFFARPEIAPEVFTEREINSGDWLSHWPGLAITSRKDKDFYADIVKSQVMAFHIPVGTAKSETGWHKDSTSGLWTYVFRDGRLLTNEPELSNPNIPIAGYTFPASYALAWREHMSETPGQASREETEKLFAWLASLDPHGRGLLLCMGAYRSLFHSIERLDMAAMVAAADDVAAADGSSMAGKTLSVDFARGVDGPCPFKTSADSTFRGSLAGTETRIAALQDVIISLGDFHLPESPSESEYSKWSTMVDTLVSSAADNAEMKPRATRNMDAKTSASINGLLIMDGEKLHPLLLSRLRRFAILFYRRGEINNTELYTHHQEYQRLHTKVGHSVLRAGLTELNNDETTFRHAIRAMDAEYTTKLLEQFQVMFPAFDDKELARCLAGNFARFITGARLAEQATGALGLVDRAFGLALYHIGEQAHLLHSGGPSCIDRPWLLRNMYLLLHDRQGHVLDHKNQPLTENEYGLLEPYGYKRGIHDGEWVTCGPHVANISKDQEYYHFLPTALQQGLKPRAAHDKLKWTYGERTFPETLVQLGIVEPEESKKGQKGKSAKAAYIAGKYERRLWVPAALLDIDRDAEDDETPGPKTPGPKTPGPEDETYHQAADLPPPEEPYHQDEQETDAAERYLAEHSLIDNMAAARALLQEIKERGCSLHIRENGTWGIGVPEVWTDQQFQEHAQRIYALDKELRQILTTDIQTYEQPQEQSSVQEAGQARTTSDEQETTPDIPEKRQKRDVLYIDVTKGQGGHGNGEPNTYPRSQSEPEIVKTLLPHVDAEHVTFFLCGDMPAEYREWLFTARMSAEYTTSAARGHHEDPDNEYGHVARYSHRISGREIEIRAMVSWWGDNTYVTPEDAYNALALLDQYLQAEFRTKQVYHYSTPGLTFQTLWKLLNRMEKRGNFPPLPEDIRALIRNTSGQGRAELCTPGDARTLPGLHYYDGIFMYAGLTWGMPNAVAAHDDKNEHVGKVPARYRIRYTVPESWQHIGPFMTPRQLLTGNAQDNDLWCYPGEDARGRTFETWADGAEIDVLIQHYAEVPKNATTAEKKEAAMLGLSRVRAAWQLVILERIVFSVDSSHKPLDSIASRLVKLREKVERDAAEDTTRTHLYKLVRGAIRNILLHGIGSFNRKQRNKTYILRAHDTAPEGYIGTPRPLADGRLVYTVPEKTEVYTQQFEHPEWAALIWARCRARMFKQALSLPRNEVIAIRVDALCVTREHPEWDNNTEVGTLRPKWHITKKVAAPHKMDDLDALIHKYVKDAH